MDPHRHVIFEISRVGHGAAAMRFKKCLNTNHAAVCKYSEFVSLKRCGFAVATPVGLGNFPAMIDPVGHRVSPKCPFRIKEPNDPGGGCGAVNQDVFCDVAVLFSKNSRDAFSAEDGYYQREWLGWTQLLMRNNVMFEVLLDGDITSERLSKYRLLILPKKNTSPHIIY